MIDKRLLICAAASLLGHFLLKEAVATLPQRRPPALDHKIEVRVIAAPVEPPPPEPEKPPEEKPEVKPEPKLVHDKATPTPHTVQPTVHDVISKDTPIAEHAVVEAAASGPPVFGVTMESTSSAGGPAMPVGNTTTPGPGAATSAPVKAQAAPVAAAEVTKMPLPQGRCAGKYTDAARAAATEGTVVLDLVVDETGRAREIKVVTGLDNGLTEAAIKALQDCRFTPGERAGQPVPVRVRGFKIRFVLQDAQ